jgi:WD40 repeat protein
MYLPVAGKEMRSIMLRQKFEGHTERVNCVIHLPGGQRIVTCSHDKSLQVWNLESGEQIGDDWRDGEHPVMTIALSPDGKRIVSGEMFGMVKLWDIDTGKVIIRWTGDVCPVTSLCWNQDCRRVLTGTRRVWNTPGLA